MAAAAAFLERAAPLILELDEALLGPLVRDELRAQFLERLAASRMIEMMVAVDHIFDWRLGDFPNFLDIGLRRRASQADRVSGDDASLDDVVGILVGMIAQRPAGKLGAFDLYAEVSGSASAMSPRP